MKWKEERREKEKEETRKGGYLNDEKREKGDFQIKRGKRGIFK